LIELSAPGRGYVIFEELSCADHQTLARIDITAIDYYDWIDGREATCAADSDCVGVWGSTSCTYDGCMYIWPQTSKTASGSARSSRVSTKRGASPSSTQAVHHHPSRYATKAIRRAPVATTADVYRDDATCLRLGALHGPLLYC
jgi:hypothetical protein